MHDFIPSLLNVTDVTVDPDACCRPVLPRGYIVNVRADKNIFHQHSLIIIGEKKSLYTKKVDNFSCHSAHSC